MGGADWQERAALIFLAALDIIQGNMIRQYLKKIEIRFVYDISKVRTFHYSWCIRILIVCPERYKKYHNPIRQNSLEKHQCSHRYCFSFKLSLPIDYLWIFYTQKPWGETRTPLMRPSCSVREEQALCFKSHLILHSSTLRLTEPIPSY